MHPIRRSEILPIGEYTKIREPFRSRVIEGKRPRRVRLGEHMSAVFENRDSVRFQIQEMLRTERITSEPGILHEIETYNELLPGPGELSLTFFVDTPDRALRDRMLVELAGLEDSIGLEVDGQFLPAKGKRVGALPDRTTAVHYLKISLPHGAQARIRAGTASAALVVSHPKYSARAVLDHVTLRKLAEDLA